MPAALHSPFESPHAEAEVFISQESQEREFLKKRAKSGFLVHSSNIRKSPGPQREASGLRTIPLATGLHRSRGCCSGYEPWKQGSHTLFEAVVCFSCSSSPGPLGCAATKAASCAGCRGDACQQQLNYSHRLTPQLLPKQPSAGVHSSGQESSVSPSSWAGAAGPESPPSQESFCSPPRLGQPSLGPTVFPVVFEQGEAAG